MDEQEKKVEFCWVKKSAIIAIFFKDWTGKRRLSDSRALQTNNEVQRLLFFQKFWPINRNLSKTIFCPVSNETNKQVRRFFPQK
jgi:hypothetical protein